MSSKNYIVNTLTPFYYYIMVESVSV